MAARLYVRQRQPDAAWTGAPSGFPFNPTDSWSRIPFNVLTTTSTSPLSSTNTISRSSTTSSTEFSSLSSTSIKATSVPSSQTQLGATTTTAIPTPSHVTSSRTVNVAAIGGAVGGIIVLILLLLFYYIIYRKKRLRRKTPTPIEPYFFVSENARALPDNGGEISQSVVGEIQHPNTLSQSIKQRSGNLQVRPEPIISRQTADNQEELSTQIRQIQQTMTELQSQLMQNTQVDARALEADHPSDRDIRQEILILRSEIERLQASQEEVIRVQNNMDHLPDYDEAV